MIYGRNYDMEREAVSQKTIDYKITTNNTSFPPPLSTWRAEILIKFAN